ncbi:hypothetical protein HDU84_004739 [Entophlyctis sp. JEL0112]|nr:hypothetical protein HDU84_004739 [Entophlyctis sp. JEL0112]
MVRERTGMNTPEVDNLQGEDYCQGTGVIYDAVSVPGRDDEQPHEFKGECGPSDAGGGVGRCVAVVRDEILHRAVVCLVDAAAVVTVLTVSEPLAAAIAGAAPEVVDEEYAASAERRTSLGWVRDMNGATKSAMHQRINRMYVADHSCNW